MAIYISKDAMKNIPLGSEDGDKDRGILRSVLLRRDTYLVALVNNPNSTGALKRGMEHPSIREINFSFDVVNLIYYPDDPLFILTDADRRSDDFSLNVENNVKLLQEWQNLPVTGVIDAETLLVLDSLMSEEVLIDYYTNKVYGVPLNREVSFVEDYFYNADLDEFEYKLNILISTENETHSQSIKIYYAPPRGFAFDNLNGFLTNPSNETQTGINNANLEFRNYQVLIDNTNTTSEFIFETKSQSINSTLDLEGEIQNTPPTMFGDMGKTYKVSEGENFSDVVLSQYYNTGDEYLVNPEDNTTIFTFPNRIPLPNREDDARFQFYLNLLYYSNTQEMGSDIESWGMKMSNGFNRYITEQLEEYNIFNNNYEPSDANTALPNYYRFLKHMETVNSDSRLVFQEGNCLNFEAQAGKNIVVPSRKFADTIYYLLNYRHGEMLQAVGNKMVQVQGSALAGIINTLQSALNTLTGVAQVVKTQAIILYEESADFFIKALDFLIDFIKDYWPRGAGGMLKLDTNVTWGIPIATNGATERTLWRKVSSEDDLVICFGETQTIKVGVDVAAQAGFGLYSGVGKKKKTLGVNLGVGAEALSGLDMVTEYEFPLRPDETMLIAGLMAFLGPNTTNIATDLLRFFNIMNLEPRQYLTKMQIKISNELNAWAKADLGLTQNGKDNLQINRGQTETEMDNNKSYGYIDNILSLLPGAGVIGEISALAGISLTVLTKYDNNPRIPELDSRVFSEQNTELKYFTKAKLTTGLLGEYFQKLFLSTALPDSGLFNINFDRGILIGHKTKIVRQGDPRLTNLADIKVNPNTTQINQLSDGSIQYVNQGSSVSINSILYLGMFHGDVESLAESGTEARLNISMAEVMNIFNNFSTYEYSFDNVKKVLLGFEYRKKIGIFKKDSKYVRDKAKRERHSGNTDYTDKTISVFKSASGTDNETQLLVELFKKMSTINKYLDSAMAIDIKMNVDFSVLISIFEFYIKKLYYKYSLSLEQQEEFENALIIQRSIIENNVKKKLMIETGTADKYSKEFYNYVFAESNSYTENGVQITFKGLNGYIDEQITENPPTGNYLTALSEFIKSPPSYNNFLREIPVTSDYDTKDIGIFDFIEYFTLLTDIGGLELDIEGIVGASAGVDLRLATARVGLGGFAQLTYQGKIFENGVLTDLGINDPLYVIFKQLELLLACASDGKKIPARNLIDMVR